VAEAVARVTQRAPNWSSASMKSKTTCSGRCRLNESRRVVKLYDAASYRLPQKKHRIWQAGYVAGKVDFLRLIEAQRQLSATEKSSRGHADYHRRSCELERVLAGRRGAKGPRDKAVLSVASHWKVAERLIALVIL